MTAIGCGGDLRCPLVVASLTCALACGSATRLPGDDADVELDGAQGDGGDCEALTGALVTAFEEAVLCDPGLSSPQCDGVELITNRCGCPWAANNGTPALAQAARDAWVPYEAAGCVPATCGPCRDPTPTFGCTMLPIGTAGTCEVVGR